MLGQISSSKNSRSITEDIAQAETKLRDLRKERAQEVILLFQVFFNVGFQVIRVAAAREELQKARTKHSGARDQLEGKALAPFFSSNIQFIAFTCLLQQFIVTLCL